jgi:uncharacterized protein YcbK (DUF882 family)
MSEFAREGRQLTENFHEEEFLCRHCRQRGIQPDFVKLLQRLRNALARPVIINSGFRCMAHPVERAKTPGSYSAHTYGIAADISVPTIGLRDLYNTVLTFPEFRGIGVDPWRKYIHVDTRAKVARWTYRKMADTARWNGQWETLYAASGYKVE